MASYRAEILGLLPRRGAPPASRLLRRVGGADGPARRDRSRLRLHGDLVGRPHPSEVRDARDPQPRPADFVALTGAFVALFQALCAYALAEPRRVRDFGFRVVYDQNRWAASRFGPRATFIHPDDGRRRRGFLSLRRSCSIASARTRASSGRRSCSTSIRARPLRRRPPARGRPGGGARIRLPGPGRADRRLSTEWPSARKRSR